MRARVRPRKDAKTVFGLCAHLTLAQWHNASTKQGESGRRLAAVRVVRIVALEGRAAIVGHGCRLLSAIGGYARSRGTNAKPGSASTALSFGVSS